MSRKRKKQFPKGLSEKTVREISKIKDEPDWMLKVRLEAYHYFEDHYDHKWGPDLSALNFDKIKYYAYAGEKKNTWEEVPSEIKDTFDQLGIPEVERKYLAGLTTQYESEAIYHNLKERWQSLGILFEDTDTALKKYPEHFKEYFGKLIPYTDNKFAALNTAVWSGGTVIYVPRGVQLPMPVQTYFRINTEQMGQFERTLIIAEEESNIHYIEGCTAPQYMTNSLHSAVVEIFLKKTAQVRYTTIQNWSKNIYNLVTKRAIAEEKAVMEWVDCNIGSKVTMKYPSVILKGDNSKAYLLSMNLADSDQNIDAGGKMLHIGENSTSIIDSKSISRKNGISTYRGTVNISEKAKNARSFINCESLLIDDESVAFSYPIDQTSNSSSTIEHEASVSKISRDQLLYLQSRGLSKREATQLIVSGFISPIVEQLPTEYAIELERLIELSNIRSERD
ncbi:Fe-S cluster assembly protein SufB [Candidatus Dojkabacteria bacterium]|nr:Fe-S cluster assembly protein SufB [Candidatus Dojkabacteria bacterium]